VTYPSWDRERFGSAFDVSRETLAGFDAYRDILLKWNRRINLISRSTEADIWGRHFADSAQLRKYCPAGARRWADLGSGAGFPGLVIALLAREASPGLRVVMVESDARKAAFLVAAAQAVGVQAEVVSRRVEATAALGADVVSARAVAALPLLLGLAEKHLRPGGICLFPKGETVHKELEEARRSWQFQARTHPSLTDTKAGILQIGAISRV
jgi:16S rRNA (guanine527-N7)-methyltransferase